MSGYSFVADNLSAGENGHLYFAGQDVCGLAERYGTPCYLFDEDRIRANCRMYLKAVASAFDGRGRVMYASKAASFKHIYEIMREEGMSIDVVSCGEILTAKKAGFPLENAFFHSNNKTDADVDYAMENGVGCFVADNPEELYAIDRAAGRRGITQNVLLRLTPGIDPHTFAAVSTGKVDSKFGFAIATGQAEEALQTALGLANVRLTGFHCHVGSQLFDSDVYLRAADTMLDFVGYAYNKYGFAARVLDLGGGYGVRYIDAHSPIDIPASIAEVGAFVKKKCAALGIDVPEIGFEPGRSIVADAGLTVYEVGSVKRIPGFINYVSVDGGMTDNIRYALYGAPYTVLPVNRLAEPAGMKCNLVGRCCESGDVLQCGVTLPETTTRGDLVAVCTTGAYNYSMASNYNRVPRPPIVMLRGGRSFVAVRRETFEDLTALDV